MPLAGISFSLLLGCRHDYGCLSMTQNSYSAASWWAALGIIWRFMLTWFHLQLGLYRSPILASVLNAVQA